MFGYVTPLTEELKVKEHIFYKSVYCGLCRCMGKRVCTESRLTLSYDVVFLVLVRLALTGETQEFDTGRCVASPLKKKVFLKPNETLSYSAAAGALLAYYNLADNARDSRGAAKAGAGVLLGMLGRMRKKAGIPELDRLISGKLSALTEQERSGCATLDSAASLFGELLSEVFAYGLEGSGARIASQIGYHVGKWIYTADAADDFSDDRKKGSFNPLPGLDKEALRCSMTLELEAAAAAIALISLSDTGIRNIIENILYLGMPSRMEKILSRYPDEPASHISERNVNP